MANSLFAVAEALQQRRKALRLSYRALGERAGVTELSARAVLLGRAAPKLTTLLALADVLDLELVLVPKLVAQGLEGAPTDEPPALSAVQQLVQGLRDGKR